MLRASSACCFEWSLDKLRAGLRAETLAYVIQACSSSLRGLSFAGLPVDAALSPLTRCSALTRLDLAGCSLDDQHLPGLNNVLANTLTLSQLDLSANELGQGHLLELRHLPNLTSLSLSMNRLRTLPQDVSTLSSLTLLHLGANALDAVPDALRCLNRLTDLDLGPETPNPRPSFDLAPEIPNPRLPSLILDH
jgi:internalin A